MLKKKVMIIGGGKWQVPIIKKAKKLGYTVINTNLYSNSEGFKYSDFSYVVNVLDKKGNFEVAKKHKPDAVITDQSDIAVNTVAYIAEKLGLLGVGIDVADLYTNKSRMRQELKAKNLHHPKYKVCKSLEEALAFLNELQGKAIIKPLSSQSSRGVVKINSINELKRSYAKTLTYSINNSILIEEYIGGIELTVEGFKTKDQHFTLAVSKKTHYKNLPSVANSLLYLNSFNEFNINEIITINNFIFDKLKFGITHVEYKYFNNKFYLIEAAIRGGGTKISSHIIPKVSGVDVNELLIETALTGKTPAFSISPKVNNTILKFFDFKSGKVSKIHGLENFKDKRIIDYDFEFEEGEQIYSPEDDRSRLGYFIASSEKEESLSEIVDLIEKGVCLEYK